MPLTPNNREEHWLQGMVDGSTDLTPNKRREYWYKEIVDAIGSGGGGGGGGLVVNISQESDVQYADKTWKEIHDVVASGGAVYALDATVEGVSVFNALSIITSDTTGDPYWYSVQFGSIELWTTTENGYPNTES